MSSLNLDKFTVPPDLFVKNYEPMTINGTVVRTAILLGVSVVAGAVGWMFLPASMLMVAALLGVGGAIAFSVMASRRPLNAKVPAFAYAAMQGLLIGAVARLYENAYEGVVVMALLATAVTVASTLVLFATGLVRPSKKVRSIVLMATMAIFGFYAISIVLSMLGMGLPALSGPWGIVISLVILGVAIMNLFTDYTIVMEAIEEKADERFEWFAAFGLTATVLWVFVEFLRLFARSR